MVDGERQQAASSSLQASDQKARGEQREKRLSARSDKCLGDSEAFEPGLVPKPDARAVMKWERG